MKKIELTKGESVLVSDIDFKYLNQFKWCCQVVNHGGRKYAVTNIKKSLTSMSRIILKERLRKDIAGKIVIYKDGNSLNCQRSNLILTDKTDHRRVRVKYSNNKTGYTGVQQRKDKFQALIRINKKNKYIGTFSTKEEASEAYNEIRKAAKPKRVSK